MADEIYNVGTGDSDIFIAVDVSTPGIASTEVDNTQHGSTSQVAASSDATGSIAKVKINEASSLNNAEIEVDTDIDLIDVSSSLWPTLFKNLVITYKLSGGADSEKSFSCEDDDKSTSTSGRIIHVAKIIKLKTN